MPPPDKGEVKACDEPRRAGGDRRRGLQAARRAALWDAGMKWPHRPNLDFIF